METLYERILLIQLGDIGDVILTLPVVQALRDNYPLSCIVVCVRKKARDIMDDCPWVSEVMDIPQPSGPLKERINCHINWFKRLRRYRFNLAIDLRTGTRGAIIAGLSGAATRIGRFSEDGGLWRNRIFTRLVHPPPDELDQYASEHNLNILSPLQLHIRNHLPRINVPSYRKQSVKGLFRNSAVPSDKPIVVVHPFSLWQYKEWQVESCAELIDDIQLRYGVAVVITGSAEERSRAEQVVNRCQTMPFNLAGYTSVGELAAVLETSCGFIGVDTAALHLAAAAGIPTLGIFGPSSINCWAPRGDHHHVVFKDMPCVPCRRKGCNDSEISRCLKELTVDDIREKLYRFMEEITRTSGIRINGQGVF